MWQGIVMLGVLVGGCGRDRSHDALLWQTEVRVLERICASGHPERAGACREQAERREAQHVASPQAPYPVWWGEPGPVLSTGQVPVGTLVPTPILGEYWVEGQPSGTVHTRP